MSSQHFFSSKVFVNQHTVAEELGIIRRSRFSLSCWERWPKVAFQVDENLNRSIIVPRASVNFRWKLPIREKISFFTESHVLTTKVSAVHPEGQVVEPDRLPIAWPNNNHSNAVCEMFWFSLYGRTFTNFSLKRLQRFRLNFTGRSGSSSSIIV